MKKAISSGLVVGIIGKDGRTSAIERKLRESAKVERVFTAAEGKEKSRDLLFANVSEAVKDNSPDFIIVGPEEPLANGVVDYLWLRHRVPCIGPTTSLARLESSKSFTRALLNKYSIPGNPEHRVFSSIDGLERYLHELGSFVVKPDGLTGGKGVKVSGVHLHSINEAMDYCSELLGPEGSRVLIEEKLEGEEFSLQSFSDGLHVKHMPPVQDHKRAYDGDTGPNTGGMGSYSCSDHTLPFLDADSLAAAQEINQKVAQALLAETREEYKGILFGGFMITANGIRLLEYNARFGDPEALNVLSILETDFGGLCEHILDGTLDKCDVRFRRLATVCKYVVPKGYPSKAITGKLSLSRVPAQSESLQIYRAAVRDGATPNEVFTTGSRAIAFVGIAGDLPKAERIAESAAAAVEGPARHRADIGTTALIEQRVRHMRDLGAARRQQITWNLNVAPTGADS